MTREQVYKIIDGEREYQARQWSSQEERPLSIGEFILAMEEYLAKSRAKWSTEQPPEIGALDIIRKVTALGVACMEKHGAPERK